MDCQRTSLGRGTLTRLLAAGLLAVVPGRGGEPPSPVGPSEAPLRLDSVSSDAAQPGDRVTLRGEGFGVRRGAIVVTGRRVVPVTWSDTEAAFVVPDDGASGSVSVRTAEGVRSVAAPFAVERPLPDGQIAPHGLVLEDTGLPGAAFLVETDGTCLFGFPDSRPCARTNSATASRTCSGAERA